MEINIYVSKFNRLVQRVFEENYELSRYHAEHLVKHLDDNNDNAAKILLGTPMFSDIIYHSIENLHSVSTQNKIFIIDVLTILFKNELQFNRLQTQGLQLCLLKRYLRENVQAKYPSPDMHYAGIKMATAQLSHTSGLKLVIHCKLWESILCSGTHLRPAYVAKAAYKFISEVVWKLDELEEEAALIEVIEYIVLPIKTSGYQTLTVFDPNREYLISEPLITPMNALLTIMSDTGRLIKSKSVVSVLKMLYFIDAPLYKLIAGSRDHNMICLVNDIAFRLYFTLVCRAVAKDGKTESDMLNEMIAFFLNQITCLTSKKMMIPATIDFVVKANIFWSKVGSSLYSSTFERNGQMYQIENQFMVLAILPLLAYSATTYRHADEVLERYKDRMGKTVTEHIIKSCYSYKAMITAKGNLKQTAIQATRALLQLKGSLNAEQAGMMFQSLYYVLELFVPSDEEDRVKDDNPLKTAEDVKLLSLLLEVMKMLLMEHNIHWYDHLEIISLQNGMMNLMTHNSLPSKQLQQVLDLIDLSIRKFLCPDMALLVESKRGSTLDDLAAVLKSYIHHEEWEVRETALSLLLSFTDVAFVKYVPLQKQISENGLMLLATHAAFNDPEYYVRTTALKCLASATKIEGIWREVLTANRHLYKELIFLLRHNPEGMIRREAINVLNQIYVNQKTTPQFEKCMYCLMTTAAIDDLHWEVQLAALSFWRHVIKKHLSNKGMIDGKFPKVTFSKEKRKIVVLDEKEVKKQLASIMNILSDVGCLTVLHHCLNEELSTEVMSYAQCISQELVDILNFHNFGKVPEDASTPPADEPMHEAPKEDTDIEMILDLSFVLDTESRREKVIDEIVNTKLEDLIMNLNNKYVNFNAGVDEDISFQPPKKTKIRPNKFLEDFKGTDYVNLIKRKKNWNVDNQSLDQLLDEILER